tara:strand:- start:244 stop:414 length:171 start_codon:yes stop_codon:yes gene_type:complete
MKVTVELDIRCAAAAREQLFRSTSQDSYEFPSERTKDIRKVITALDEVIEAALKDD